MEMNRREFSKLAALGAAGLSWSEVCAETGGRTTVTVLNPESYRRGCGLCVAIQTPSGKTYLFDTGVGCDRRRNNGRTIIIPWLRARGVKAIDGLVVSHYHSDHFGGLFSLCPDFPIRRIFNNNFNPPGADGKPKLNGEGRQCRDLLDAWAKAHPGALVEDLREGTDLGWDEPGVSFEIVWPPRDAYIREISDRPGYGANDTVYHHLLNGNSNALRITVGQKVFFILSDIQPDYIEKYMIPYLQPKGKWGCDVCILPAHGTKPEVAVGQIGRMDPKPAAVVAPLGNSPWMIGCAKSCRRIYEAAGYRFYSTNQDGHVAFGFGDGTISEKADRTGLVPPAPAVQARAEIAWSRPICVEPKRYIGWPTVACLKNGDVVAVFSGDRDAHVCPHGKVQMVRSTDGGETWSAPRTIANGILDDRDAGIVQLPDGELVVTWFTSVAYLQEGKRHPEYLRHHERLAPEAVKEALGYFLIRSKDNGATWSKPEKLADCDQTPHGPILLKDGSLLQIGRRTETDRDAASRNVFSRTVISVSRSTDAGRTWNYLCREIPSEKGENDRPGMFHEPHVAERADGTLVGVVRFHGDQGEGASLGNGYMRVTFSKDGGRTWTPMTATPMLGLPPHLLSLPDGRLLCVYGRRLPKPGFGEFACLSDDGGKTWDVANEIVLSPSFCGDLGYPATCILPTGELLTVYYQRRDEDRAAPPCLMATKWRVVK